MGHFDLDLAHFVLVFEGAALDDVASFVDDVVVLALKLALLGFDALFHHHPAGVGEIDDEFRLVLALAGLGLGAALAVDAILDAVDDHDAFDGIFLFLLEAVLPIVVIVIVIVVEVGDEGLVVIHGVAEGVAVHIAVGDDALHVVIRAVGCLGGDGESAVGEQALHQRHIAVQFLGDGVYDGGDGFGHAGVGLGHACVGIGVGRGRVGCGGIRSGSREACRAAVIHRGDEHTRRCGAEAVDLFRGVEFAEAAVPAGVEAAATAGTLAGAGVVAGDEGDAKSRRKGCYYEQCDYLFHGCCLLLSDFARGSRPVHLHNGGRGAFCW